MISNPFSTRHINPAICQFIQPATIPNGEALIQKLVSRDDVEQIVGPHGCGKSTLAYSIARQCSHSFSQIISLTVRSNEHQIIPQVSVHRDCDCPASNEPSAHSSDKGLTILDGIERLTPLNRSLLIRCFRKRNTKLLLTTHRAILGAKILVELVPDPEQFQSIVYRLQCDHDIKLTDRQISNAYQEFRGNYRLALRRLYDNYEFERKARHSKIAG